ncbi:hypothetical protein VTJ49DRAFT_2181 [Mycothermus thermophilus]|uniref:Uncharacterized protein n=1 Tax=Humicola insolens TaxID=85995 RepID=A0ABR3VAG4_HUMIN
MSSGHENCVPWKCAVWSAAQNGHLEQATRHVAYLAHSNGQVQGSVSARLFDKCKDLESRQDELCDHMKSLVFDVETNRREVVALKNTKISRRDAVNLIRDEMGPGRRNSDSEEQDKMEKLEEDFTRLVKNLHMDLNKFYADTNTRFNNQGHAINRLKMPKETTGSKESHESRLRQLEERVKKAEAANKTLRADHNALRADHHALRAEHAALQADHNALRTETQILRQGVAQSRVRIEQLEDWRTDRLNFEELGIRKAVTSLPEALPEATTETPSSRNDQRL